MKYRFIFNPRSGHNAANPYLRERARAFIAEQKLDATLVETAAPRHATDLAREAVEQGCDVVVAIGGDGTLNEVAAALINTPAALGLVPCGSGNGLGRHLGIPSPGKGAFRNLLSGRIRSIDTGSANGIPFFNAMGLGFDAEIADRFNGLTKRGLPAYTATAWRTWFGYRPSTYTIVNGTQSLETEAFIVAIANSDQYGNDCFIAPGASVDDGLLDLTVLRNVTFASSLPLAVRLFTRRIDGNSRVMRLRGDHFSITRPTAGPIHTDGEIHQTTAAVDISIRPLSLRVLVPPSR